jgi:glycerophosphoryl diester phosphodiesterase
MTTDLSWLTAGPFAHRGLHDGKLPENSLAAVEAAVAAGYGVELDVQLSADGRAMVFHDSSLQRMCGRADLVHKMSAADLARTHLLGTAETVPTLADALDLIGGRVPLLVEIKKEWGDCADIDRATAECLGDYPGQAAVQSFEPQVCIWFKQHRPDTPRGWISCRKDKNWLGMPALEKFRRSLFIDQIGAEPDFFVYDHRDLPFWPVEGVRETGKPVLVYTVKSETDAARAQPYVDNIIFEGFQP